MLNWIITFCLLAIVASIFGFGGLAGDLAGMARFLAGFFIILFIASLVYSVITGRRPPSVPPL